MKSEHARTLAQYNRWMNQRLYEVCGTLSDADRKEDRAAFFSSIHGTLNHLLLGDRLWMGRFTLKPFPVESLDQELYADWKELCRERGLTDNDIIEWAENLTDTDLGASLEFNVMVDKSRRTCPLWILVTHFFNHQTHHRGQLTTLLSQAGADPGVTDLMWLPGLMGEAQP